MAGYIDRSAMAATLNLLGAKTALTLVYNDHRPTLEKMRADLHRLKRRVDRRLFGRHLDKIAPSDLTQVWAVIEGLGTHPHIHTGWKLPHGGQELLEKLMAEAAGAADRRAPGATAPASPPNLWQTFAPAGSYHITGADDQWAAYACKELTTTDHVLFLPDRA